MPETVGKEFGEDIEIRAALGEGKVKCIDKYVHRCVFVRCYRIFYRIND